MKKLSDILIGKNSCSIFVPDDFEQKNQKFPIAYLLGINSSDQIEKIQTHLSSDDLIIAGIGCDEWEKFFTPWSAPGLKNRKPFEGCADDFLNSLEKDKEEIEKSLPVFADPDHRLVIGYSLAGLTSVYASFVTDFATNFGGISASLWYPGWTDFCKNNCLKNPHAKNNFYLSLGDKEHISKNKLMATVDECFVQTVDSINQKENTSIFFETNVGGHFNDCEKRIARGINFLCSKFI